MNLDQLSDEELVALGKDVIRKIAERMELNKAKVSEWSYQFKTKSELLYNYLDQIPRNINEISKELSVHLNEKEVLSILNDLVGNEKVIESNGYYSRR